MRKNLRLYLIRFLNYILLLWIDSALNNKMLSMLLKGVKCVCDSAENGKAAVDKVAANLDKFEIIFMDYTMPVMVSL